VAGGERVWLAPTVREGWGGMAKSEVANDESNPKFTRLWRVRMTNGGGQAAGKKQDWVAGNRLSPEIPGKLAELKNDCDGT